MDSWINGGGPQNEIILSSRIRLARNINEIPFPPLMDADKVKRVVEMVTDEKINLREYKLHSMNEMNQTDKQVLVERHLISPNLVGRGSMGAALIKSDEVVSIMMNEEDHIRIQAILPGMQIKKVWEIANEVDDRIESQVEYAFDENWGYLTSCPTNVGTGMRASVMVHLPALNMTGSINKILHAVTQIGLTIRGLYGEGTEFIGNIFQLSNQITLGRLEEELIDNLTGVTAQIIEKEKEARSMLLKNNKMLVEDKVWRSMGIMKNARIMKSQECLRLLSDIRLGVDLGILYNIPTSLLNEVMIETQPASLQKLAGRELAPEERDVYRAEVIRKKISQI